MLATYGFDPGLQTNDKEVSIQRWEVWGEVHIFKVNVDGKKKEIYPDGREWLKTIDESRRKFLEIAYPSGIAELVAGGSLFLLRVFVNAKDREKMLEITALIEKNSPKLNHRVSLISQLAL